MENLRLEVNREQVENFDYDCPGRCPLSTACLGGRDESYRGFFEPRLVTTYY